MIEKDGTIDKSKVLNLKSLSDIQPGSVVSRALISNDSGSITVFSFSKGQELSKHSAPFDAFVNIIEGKAKIIIDETDFILSDGEVIIMPADVPHSVMAVEDFKMMLVMIKG
jgi:quercetin dioxygenase-like cupin family protein